MMMYNRMIQSVLLTLSVAFYIYACTLPAYMEMAGPDYSYNDIPMYYRELNGLWCLIWGGLFMPINIFAFYDSHHNWTFIWFANVFYLIAIYRLYWGKRVFLTIIYALVAISISTLFSFLAPCYPYKDFYGQIAYLESGYFYWELSIAIVFGIATWQGVKEQSSKYKGSKVIIPVCLSMIYLAISIGFSYTQVFWDKTNDIDFDNERQCFVMRNYLNRIEIYDAVTEKTDTLFRGYDVRRKKEISVDEMDAYFSSSENILEKHHSYLITNITYPDKKYKKIRIYINDNGQGQIANTE